jgi:F-type H+-transporting ATPase subunit b
MISLLLAASTPALEATHGADASGPAALLEKFGFQWGYIAMQLLSFTILAVVLYRFAIKPTLATMDERNRQIESGLKNAEATAAKLAEANAAAAAQLKAAQVEANKIVDEARKASKELSEREAAAATERANALVVKAQQAIELEHKKMLADARSEIARLVVTTTERVLAKKLTDADRAAYNETATRELTSV